MKPTPPAISLHASQVSQEHLTDVLLGVEEEGVPLEVEHHTQANAAALAYQAARASKLGIGIGVAGDRVAITTDQLPEARPYLERRIVEGDVRLLGGDAARMVKRLPLRTPTEEGKH